MPPAGALTSFGATLKGIKFLKVKSDLTALVDEFASRFYGELDYRLECQNGLRIAEDLKGLAAPAPAVYRIPSALGQALFVQRCN